MPKKKPNYWPEVETFGMFLLGSRESILNDWRLKCVEDSGLSSKSSFSREEFNDQVPVLLDILHRRFCREPETVDPLMIASQHGLHRWQSGYELPELIVELEHLFATLHEVLNTYQQEHTQLSAPAQAAVYQEYHRLYSESCRGSIVYYHDLRQTTAAEQASQLQQALNQLQQLTKQRNEHLRQSSHDLRSSFSILMMSSQLWQLDISSTDKAELMGLLNRNLNSIHDMLLQLTDYARIEAGQEMLVIKKLDVGKLITDTVQLIRPAAEARGLYLALDGPESLTIKSDGVQIQRVLLNLLHNAIKYTEKGGLHITWTQENDGRWILSVQDTGPGFAENSPAGLFASQLTPNIHSTAIHREIIEKPAPTVKSLGGKLNLKESEGLGLFIVKKICELMKATMDIESRPGIGTLVRIRFQAEQEQNRQL